MAMTNYESRLVYTGYCNGDTSKPIYVYVAYKSSQSIDNNQSTIYTGMYVTTPSGWSIGEWNDYNGSYVGSTSNTFDGTIPNFSGTRWIAENLSFTVNHSSDGTGTATIYWKWGVNSSWGRIQNISGSFAIALPTIARASNPTVSASSVRMGNSVTIYTNRKSSGFTHNLTYSFGGTTGTIATGVGASYAWTVPDLAEKIDNQTSATCVINCKTYNGTTLVGSDTVSITIQVPAATTPTLGSGTVQMGNAVRISVEGKGASNFTHNVTYSIGGTSGTIYTGLKQYVNWTVPKSLANYTSKKTSATCTIQCETYNGTAKVGTTTVTLTLTVPNATVATLSAASIVLGNAITISLPRETTAYVHDITMKLTAYGSTTVVHSGTVASGKTTSCVWSIPLSYASKIPSSTIGTITLTVVTRFSDSTTQVGSNAISFTVTVPDNSTTKPTISVELSPTHSLPDKFAGIYIQSKSSVTAAMTAGSTYSTVKTYMLTVNADTKSSSSPTITSDILSMSGSISVKCTVVDARGYSNSIEQTIEVIAYSNPKVIPYTGESKAVCARSLSDGTINPSGTYLLFKAGRKYSSVIVNGEQLNFCYLRYRYMASTASEFSTWQRLIAKDDLTIDQITAVKGDGGFDAKISYVVQINVYDDAGFGHTVTFDIPTAEVDIHLKKNMAAFGKYAEIPNAVEIKADWDLYLHGDAIADHVIEKGLYTTDTGSWRYRKWNSGTYDISGIFDVQPTESNAFSNGVAYYSNQIQITLPFSVESIEYTGTPAEQYYWMINAALVSAESGIIGFRLARLTAINTTSPVNVRLVGHGRWK